jgi:hypothetical protein
VIETPEAGSLQDSLRPTFGWSSSQHAASYTIVVSSFSDYSSPLVNVTTSATSYVPTVNLPPGTLIYWRVMANGTHPSLWSAATFTTPNPPKSPTLSSPANKALVNTYSPVLKWNAAVIPAGAPPLAYYHIQVDDDADFSSPLYDQADLMERTFTIPTPLTDNQRYYWRVRAVNTVGHYASWSTRYFRTRIITPVIEAPQPATITESLRPTFTWTSSPSATSYTLVVSTYSNFSTPLVNVTTTGTSYIPTVKYATRQCPLLACDGQWRQSQFVGFLIIHHTHTPQQPGTLIACQQCNRLHVYSHPQVERLCRPGWRTCSGVLPPPGRRSG